MFYSLKYIMDTIYLQALNLWEIEIGIFFVEEGIEWILIESIQIYKLLL